MPENVRLAERVPIGSFYRANLEAVEDVRSRTFIALWLPAFLLVIAGIGVWESLAWHDNALKDAQHYQRLAANVLTVEEGRATDAQWHDLRMARAQIMDMRENAGGHFLSPYEKALAFNPTLIDALNAMLQGRTDHIGQVEAIFSFAAAHYRAQASDDLRYGQGLLLGGAVALFFAFLYAWLGILRPIGRQSRERALALARAGEFNEDVINTARVVILVVDTEQRIVLANHHCQSLLQWPRAQLLGQSLLTTLVAAGDRPAMAALLADSDPDRILEIPAYTASGGTRVMAWSATAVRDVSGRELLQVAMGVDVTERAQAQVALQGALQQAQMLSDRLRDEAQQAAALHAVYLGHQIISLPGLSGLATSITSSEVGGDYFDSYATAHVAVALLGDVSGHGLAAGSIVAVAKAAVNQLREQGIGCPKKILHHLNGAILGTAQGLRLMTMVCAAVDFRRGILQVANAGHQFPYLQWPDGCWELLDIGGLPLGQEASAAVAVKEWEIPLGSRLLLISDGWVEEISPLGEPFGYERLEAALTQLGEANDEALRDGLFRILRAYCGREDFEDDMTIMVLRHDERLPDLPPMADKEVRDIVRIAQSFYQQTSEKLAPRLSRQHLILFAEEDWQALLPRMARDGLRRVLVSQDSFLQMLGWDRLLTAHQEIDDELSVWMNAAAPIQLPLTQSTDKDGILAATSVWLQEAQAPAIWIDTLTLMADELVENALYAAPRDARGEALYAKGVPRILGEQETAHLRMARRDNLFALQMMDSWGTLTPAVFLQRLTAYVEGDGLLPGIGGGGLYLLWRLADYLQIRVVPGRESRLTVFVNLDRLPTDDRYPSFQFLYHNDIHEWSHEHA
ncbi:PP2C family protein-serine/threonine phosphatase [Acidithiobacillus sp.]